jgi:hypothetical protein
MHDDKAPDCKRCGVALALMGKLPVLGLKPMVKVFRCDGRRDISWTEH